MIDETVDAAIKEFQQSRGITVDGIVGPETFRRLEEARWSLGDRILSFTPGHLVHGDDVFAASHGLYQYEIVVWILADVSMWPSKHR